MEQIISDWHHTLYPFFHLSPGVGYQSLGSKPLYFQAISRPPVPCPIRFVPDTIRVDKQIKNSLFLVTVRFIHEYTIQFKLFIYMRPIFLNV
jgi:hypothetical protein